MTWWFLEFRRINIAAVAFDPLEYAQQLEAAGMPRAQAEVVARGVIAMFVHNFDALVTKDYLDTRFREFETRMESAMDKRFVQVDKRFAEVERRFDSLEDRLEVRFERIYSRCSGIYLMFGITMVAVTIPVLQKLFG